ncbi:MAG: hypothetical protein GEU91_16040 [Rhizobiales bacterium]|nr:hypothetical protein [Hyphomicrobiales bacterium]
MVKRLDAEIDHEQGVLNTLDRKREAKAMEGTAALRDHVFSMTVQSDVVRALEDARAKAATRLAEVSKREAKAKVEAEVAKTHAENIPALEAAWKRLHGLLTDVAAAAADIQRHETAVEAANWTARHADRPDLVQRVRSVRDGVAAAHAVPMPDRLAGPPPVPLKGETNDAFSLRVANHQAARTDVARRNEPFVTAGTAAIEAIAKVAVDDPDVRTALRLKMAKRLDKVTPLKPPPGEASNDPAERAALERAFKQQRQHRDPSNLAPKGDAGPRSGASTYNRYEFGGL